MLKGLQITHYNQCSCELLSFRDLNIYILATKRKKEGFFLSTNDATNAGYVVNSVKLFEDADIICLAFVLSYVIFKKMLLNLKKTFLNH